MRGWADGREVGWVVEAGRKPEEVIPSNRTVWSSYESKKY